MKKPTLQYAALGVLLAWALIAQLTYSSYIIYIQANAARYLRVPFITDEYTPRITALLPTYENSGLKPGDEVLAINGQPVRGMSQFATARFSLHPGDTLVLTIRRTVAARPSIFDVRIRMHTYPGEALGWTTVIVLFVFLPLTCLVVGFYVAFARPRDPLAWITLGVLASFSQLLGSESVWAVWSPWREIFIAYQSVMESTWPLWLLLFALYFPVPFPWIRKRPWVAWVAAAPVHCARRHQPVQRFSRRQSYARPGSACSVFSQLAQFRGRAVYGVHLRVLFPSEFQGSCRRHGRCAQAFVRHADGLLHRPDAALRSDALESAHYSHPAGMAGGGVPFDSCCSSIDDGIRDRRAARDGRANGGSRGSAICGREHGREGIADRPDYRRWRC